MNIEFRCPGCDKLLSVPQTAAGKQVQCPACTAVGTAPGNAGDDAIVGGDAVREAASASTGPGSLAGNPNPYQAPTTLSSMPMSRGAGLGVPTAVNAGPVLSYALDVWKKNLVLVICIGLLLAAVQTVENFAVRNTGGLANVAIQFIGLVVSLYLQIGAIQVHLKLLRGRPAVFTEVFGGGSRFLPLAALFFAIYLSAGLFLFASLLIGGAVGGLGATFLVMIAGFVLLLVYWPAPVFVIDGHSISDSIAAAPAVARPNVITTIVLVISAIVIVLVGLLAFCVGVFAAAPLATMILPAAYLMMKGEVALHRSTPVASE